MAREFDALELQIKAMASVTRIEILRLLGDPQLHFAEQWSGDPVSDGVCMRLIAEALELSAPTVSRHVDILRQAGFVTIARRQKWAHCKRDDDALRRYISSLQLKLAL